MVKPSSTWVCLVRSSPRVRSSLERERIFLRETILVLVLVLVPVLVPVLVLVLVLLLVSHLKIRFVRYIDWAKKSSFLKIRLRNQNVLHFTTNMVGKWEDEQINFGLQQFSASLLLSWIPGLLLWWIWSKVFMDNYFPIPQPEMLKVKDDAQKIHRMKAAKINF